MDPKHLKHCACHVKSSSCTKSQATKVSQKKIFELFKTSSKFTKYCACQGKLPPKPFLIWTCACQRFSSVQKVIRIPRRLKNVHVLHLSRKKTTFQTSKCPGSPTSAQNVHSAKIGARRAGKMRLSCKGHHQICRTRQP